MIQNSDAKWTYQAPRGYLLGRWEARIAEDTPDGDRVTDAYKGGSRLDPRS
jgi:hypothetical protein